MRIYIAGKITDYDNYKEHFNKAEKMLTEKGCIVLNPAILPGGLKQEEYMRICIPMLQVCDAVYMLNNWKTSAGANIEHQLAEQAGKIIHYEEKEQETIKYEKNTDKGYECTECGNPSTINYKCCELCGNDEWEERT